MRKSFSQKYESLIEEAKIKLISKIEKSKTKSAFRSDKCLRVKDENLMFNLEGLRYLIEVVAKGRDNIELLDCNGYSYDCSVLNASDFFEVVDLIKIKF